MKAEAEAEAKRLVLKAEAEGRMAIAAAIQAENAAKTAELQALLHAGMEGGQVVQIVLKDELEKIARADAEKFEHLHLGNVTVVGGADAAPSFLGKVVEAVSKVNGVNFTGGSEGEFIYAGDPSNIVAACKTAEASLANEAIKGIYVYEVFKRNASKTVIYTYQVNTLK